MGGIGTFFKSILTPPGTSARNKVVRQKGVAGDVASESIGITKPGILSGARTWNLNAPRMNDAYSGLFDLSTPGGSLRKADSVRSTLLNKANEQTFMTAPRYAGTGAIGLQEGIGLHNTNEANRGANDYYAYLSSPEGQNELYSILSTLGRQFPGVDMLALLNSILQSKPTPETGPGLLDVVASVAPLFPTGKGKK